MNNDAERKKILGQFFSGADLGRLLMSLLHDHGKFLSVIDPMAGIGDLLVAAQSQVKRNGSITGVEIDAPAAKECAKRLPRAIVIKADAFQYSRLSVKGGYSAVVTNPPYVRYQLSKRLPRGNDIRHALIRQIKRQTHLDREVSELLVRLAEGYSGIADVAVPSWILCASIMANNGWLAIIVPETWMSRSYALPVQYMLFKLFDVRYIVRDVGACWFQDALVRTCIVVAQRRPIQRMSSAANGRVFCVDLYQGAGTADSLVGNLELCGLKGVNAWSHLIAAEASVKTEKVSTRSVCMRELFPGLFSLLKRPTWMDEDDFRDANGRVVVHAEIIRDLPLVEGIDWCTLDDYGLSCSQGMRTGANEFFYLQKVSEMRDSYELHPGKWYSGDIVIPRSFCIPALKKRCDIGNSFVVKVEDLKYVLLFLDRHVRSSDLPRMVKGTSIVGTDSVSLDHYITEAENRLARKGTPVFDLSAVRTNIRKREDSFLSMWYQLPDLVDRHCPNLCVPRVNGGVVQCLYVHQSHKQRIVVDANFTTIWGDDSAAKVGLCLLNSLWFKTYSECVGAILGGGALKLEAAVIKKIVFPKYTQDQRLELESLSQELLKDNRISESLQRKIDLAVLSPFGRESERVYTKLCGILESKLIGRGVKR